MNSRLGKVFDFVDGKCHGFARKVGGSNRMLQSFLSLYGDGKWS